MGSADAGSGGSGGGGGAAGQPSDSAANMTGIALAVGGNLLVSVALNLTKHAHNVNRARASPLPYVKLPLWWVGFCATLVGELGNFAAYGFAEASIIAPLGAVSVLANAFIASLLLGEGLRLRDLVGCALCMLGSVIIVTSTPTSSVDADIDHFVRNVQVHPRRPRAVHSCPHQNSAARFRRRTRGSSRTLRCSRRWSRSCSPSRPATATPT